MYDVIVIGAGVVGAAIARELSEYKLKVLVLEKSVEAGQGTTKANSAIVHGGYDATPGTLKAKLNVCGNQLYTKLAEDLKFPLVRNGSLVIAFDEAQMKTLHALYEQGIKNKVQGMEIWDKEKTLREEPGLSKEVIGALYCASAGVTDPFLMTYALLDNAMINGVEFKTQEEVIALEKSLDGIDVKTKNNIYQSHFVVNAAGLFSDKIANMAGDDDFVIYPTKGEYRMIEDAGNVQVKRVIFQIPTERGKGVLVAKMAHRNYIVGPTSTRNEDVRDISTEDEGIHTIDAYAKKSVPNLDFGKSIRVFSGVRAKPSTGDFMIYPSKHMKGVVHAGGIESPGLASSPAIAKYVVEILDKEGLTLEKNPNFNPTLPKPVVMHDLSKEEQVQKILENPKYGKIICRCESISEGEIIDAIHRPCGAKTVDGVKRRARAGMGRCQGGFCGPRVLEILSRELNVEPTKILKEEAGSEIVIGYLKGEKECK